MHLGGLLLESLLRLNFGNLILVWLPVGLILLSLFQFSYLVQLFLQISQLFALVLEEEVVELAKVELQLGPLSTSFLVVVVCLGALLRHLLLRLH